jgi:hypothetical protein
VPHAHLRTVLVRFNRGIDQTERLATAAQQWVSVSFPRGVPRFTVQDKETVTKLAFLQAFLEWEAFLEESFVLYLLGKRPPAGARPRRLFHPATRKEAVRFIVGDRKYAGWSSCDELKGRAKMYFQDGKPYCDALLGKKVLFDEINVIRNAIAHSSAYSQDAFKSLARKKLFGAFPPKLNVGGFLSTTIPMSSPPQSFLEFYLDVIGTVAEQIVPT